MAGIEEIAQDPITVLINMLASHGFNPEEVVDDRLRKFLVQLPPHACKSFLSRENP